MRKKHIFQSSRRAFIGAHFAMGAESRQVISSFCPKPQYWRSLRGNWRNRVGHGGVILHTPVNTLLSPTLCASIWLLAASVPYASGAGKLEFQRDVRPILSDRCFKCHGPDVEKRKAKLRLDLREDALKPAKSGDHAIVPGKPDASELVSRIFSTDEKEIMPPPEMKKPLSDEQKAVLKQWIAEGAEYQPHWARAF